MLSIHQRCRAARVPVWPMRSTFVTAGLRPALDQARTAAAGKDVVIVGGANVINQYLAAGLVDDLELHIVPLILGGGARLFDGLGPDPKLA
jgi:dihydrofolate reductase